MNTKAQRIAIAEELGYTVGVDYVDKLDAHDRRAWFPPRCIDTYDSSNLTVLPNYLFDLNAIRGAVLWANENQPDGWDDELFLKTLCSYTSGLPHHATAEQWSRAFLKTMNLWKE